MIQVLIAVFVSFGQDFTGEISGEFVGVDLGCATPHSPEYRLDMSQSIVANGLGQYERTMTVISAAAPQAGFRFHCTATYHGKYLVRGNQFSAGLSRVGCDCGALDESTSESLCQRGDYFVLEAEDVPANVVWQNGLLKTQQLATPSRRLPGCGGGYPEFLFRRI